VAPIQRRRGDVSTEEVVSIVTRSTVVGQARHIERACRPTGLLLIGEVILVAQINILKVDSIVCLAALVDGAA
jgi:hypothetical protein